MASSKNQYSPNFVTPPGETLIETLEERGMTQKELSERMDRPEKTINEIIKGKSAITPDTAIQLERVLGIPAHFWIQREANYQEFLARQRDHEALNESIQWLNTLPLSQMIKYGWIKKCKAATEQLQEVLNYFGVASIHAWKSIWLSKEPKAAFRISLAFTNNSASIAAWLRHGEVKVMNAELPAYDEKLFKENLWEIRALTIAKQEDLKQNIKSLCSQSGVGVVFTPMLSQANISGSVRWVGDRPLIQLSLRGKHNDKFWFTFFHEVGHILLHGKKNIFLEGIEADIMEKEKEKEADEYAANFLIPKEKLEEFISKRDKSPNAIIRFAKSIGIHSGIVVGQLQKIDFISFSNLNELKKTINIEMD